MVTIVFKPARMLSDFNFLFISCVVKEVSRWDRLLGNTGRASLGFSLQLYDSAKTHTSSGRQRHLGLPSRTVSGSYKEAKSSTVRCP